jgi:phenylpropionate dioxygenase-like ring-hydroxylating dioxygenase large terminal subunit
MDEHQPFQSDDPSSSPLSREARQHVALARPANAWYIACRSDELGARPRKASILSAPLVLFRDSAGDPVALLDRCAHRNVPLSAGRCVAGEIECAYHGWRFDAAGVCRNVPSLLGTQEGKARRVPHYAAREQQGYVWVYASADAEPAAEPFVFPHLDDRRYVVVRYDYALEATLYNALENVLDVPHTAFLHRGLFRGGKKNVITAVVRRLGDRAEVEYRGEPRPTGLLGRVLAPGGGTVTHFDRFILPAVAQVEYALGAGSHLVISNFVTPASDFSCHLYAVVCLRLPVGGEVVRRVLTPLAKRVLEQDARILKLQTDNIKRFGGERFVSTEVDVLGGHILRLLRQAERGEAAPAGELKETRVEILA